MISFRSLKHGDWQMGVRAVKPGTKDDDDENGTGVFVL